MNRMPVLPIGQQEFETVRKERYCYIDKPMLIGRILDADPHGVHLITRPRRFGKSLNLSMLDAFFDLEYKGNAWLDGLEISKHPEKFEEAKDWYDGCRFGNADICNPWSILNYVKAGFKAGPYWVNTSGNDVVKNALLHTSDERVFKDMETLASGGSGDGCRDIRMERISGTGAGVVIEFEKARSENNLAHLANDALEQIKARRCAGGLEGTTVLYGIAFFKKTPHIVSEVLSRSYGVFGTENGPSRPYYKRSRINGHERNEDLR